MGKPGKKRIKLAKLITEAGYKCCPYDLLAAQGWERSSTRIDNDCYRWEGWARDLDDLRCRLYSYHTMTELIKTGVEISRTRMDVPTWFQVHPKKDKP